MKHNFTIALTPEEFKYYNRSNILSWAAKSASKHLFDTTIAKNISVDWDNVEIAEYLDPFRNVLNLTFSVETK